MFKLFLKPDNWGQRESTAGRMPALHMASMSWNHSITRDCPQHCQVWFKTQQETYQLKTVDNIKWIVDQDEKLQ